MSESMTPRERATAIMETIVEPARRSVVNGLQLSTLANRVTDYLPQEVAIALERLIIEAIVEAETEARNRGCEQPFRRG